MSYSFNSFLSRRVNLSRTFKRIYLVLRQNVLDCGLLTINYLISIGNLPRTYVPGSHTNALGNQVFKWHSIDKSMAKKRVKRENILNVPNFLTFARVLAAVAMFPLIMGGMPLKIVAFIFIAVALTDAFDGYAARKLNQKTAFGKTFDPIADRIFLALVVLALLMKYQMYVILLIMAREIITAPALIFLRKGDVRFEVRFIGKLTTFLQSIALPAALLDLGIFSTILVFAAGISGVLAGIMYFKDSIDWARKRKKLKR